MQNILESFIEDLSDVEKAFSALKCTEEFRAIELPEIPNEENVFEKKSIELYSLIEDSRNGIVKIPGIFILYIGGRFEDYVRTIFEEFAIKFAKSHLEFSSLPTKFQNSLIEDTSTVISSPKRYGYRDGMVKVFIRNLSKNVDDDFDNINHQCLSKTEGNMRSEILSDLFTKISIKEIWNEIGTQLTVRTYFSTQDPVSAQTQAKKYLDNFMTQRNKVAHPSGGEMTWPSYEDVVEDINYFKMLCKVLLEIGLMKIASLEKAKT